MAAVQWKIGASGFASHQPGRSEVGACARDRVAFIPINMARF
jgi:hypothetical protein